MAAGDVALQYHGPFAVYIPSVGAEVEPLGVLEVPADVAGRVPGDWRPLAEDDPGDWPQRLGEDGSTVETYDPGEGLLAQVDVWSPAPTSTPGGAPSGGHDDTSED